MSHRIPCPEAPPRARCLVDARSGLTSVIRRGFALPRAAVSRATRPGGVDRPIMTRRGVPFESSPGAVYSTIKRVFQGSIRRV